jgi:hypothetical protein
MAGAGTASGGTAAGPFLDTNETVDSGWDEDYSILITKRWISENLTGTQVFARFDAGDKPVT